MKLLFVVCNLLWLSFLNGVQVFNLLGRVFWTVCRCSIYSAECFVHWYLEFSLSSFLDSL